MCSWCGEGSASLMLLFVCFFDARGAGFESQWEIFIPDLGTGEGFACRCIYYPSPTHSVCEDTLVGACVSVCVCVIALNRLIANFN